MATNTAEKQVLRGSYLALIVLALIALGGLGLAWKLQLEQGLQVTGLNQRVVWGLYIAGFFTAVGAGAGLVALTAIGEFAPQVPVLRRRSTLLLALACMVAGGLLISMDLGAPANLLLILTAGRLNSMMTLDFWALLVTGAITLVYLIVGWGRKEKTPLTRVLGVLALIGATGLIVVESWMLAGLAAHPLWSGGMTVVSFLAAAMVSALSIVALTWHEDSGALRGWLAFGLGLSLVLVLSEVFTGFLLGEPRAARETGFLLTGELSQSFWLYIVLGLALPLVLALSGKSTVLLRLGAVLAILGVFVEKYWLLSAGQALPWLATPADSYLPTNTELIGLVGAIALAGALYLGVGKLARMQEV